MSTISVTYRPVYRLLKGYDTIGTFDTLDELTAGLREQFESMEKDGSWSTGFTTRLEWEKISVD